MKTTNKKEVWSCSVTGQIYYGLHFESQQGAEIRFQIHFRCLSAQHDIKMLPIIIIIILHYIFYSLFVPKNLRVPT